MRNPGQIWRFALVGVAVAGLYILLYLAFLGAGLAQPIANAAAFLLAIAFQYAAQARFTFAAPLTPESRNRNRKGRSAAVTGSCRCASPVVYPVNT